MKNEIAILIATYNGEKYITELLESLRNQTYRDFKCYIHDDGSEDETTEIISRYCNEKKLNIEVLEYPATGSAKANFLSMLKYIEEPYVMFCDQDDVWLEEKVEKSISKMHELEKIMEPILIFSDSIVTDSDLNVISESFMKYSGFNPSRTKLHHLLIKNVVPGCTSILNRKLYVEASKLVKVENVVMHDYWVALIASAKGQIAYINEPLMLYRQHSNNEVGAEKEIPFLKKVINSIKRVRNNNYKDDFQKWIKQQQLQAQELIELCDLNNETEMMCRTFIDINRLSKMDRVRFYSKNDIVREKYKFWFYLWC